MQLIQTTNGAYINADLVECFRVRYINAGYCVLEAVAPVYGNDEHSIYSLARFDSQEQAELALDVLVARLATKQSGVIHAGMKEG